MWCASCGSHLATGAKFCGSCGTAASPRAFQPGGDFDAGAQPRRQGETAAPFNTAFSEVWAQLKPWRLKAVFGAIEERETARALVVGGALAFTANAGFAFIGALTVPLFALSGLMGLALAASLWFSNSRIGAMFGLFSVACGAFLLAAVGEFANPLSLAQFAAMAAVAIGAARGAFAWHGMNQAAAHPIARNI